MAHIEAKANSFEGAAQEMWDLYTGGRDMLDALDEYDYDVEALVNDVVAEYGDEQVAIWGVGTYQISDLLKQYLTDYVLPPEHGGWW